MSQLFDLKDRPVIITGGLGQLGSQYSRVLAEYGAQVVIFDKYIRTDQENNSDYLSYKVDITDKSSLIEAVEDLCQKTGKAPYGLINNAALDSPPDAPLEENGPFEDYPESSWDKVMEVNLKGTFLACQVIGKKMAEAGHGSIVNIASIYGAVSPDQRIYEYKRAGEQRFYKPVAYSVSKSGIYNLTRYLATYWAKNRIRVNTLTLAGVFNNQDEDFLKGYLNRIPIGRMAEPTDYNGAIVFLMSDASSYMTGSDMVIDGGWTAW